MPRRLYRINDGPTGPDHSRCRSDPKTAQEGSHGCHKFSSRCAAFRLWYGGRVRRFGIGSAGALGPVRALAQGAPASNASAEDFFYREDWFGEPWRKPETAVLIHGNEESSIVWYAWMPRMAQEFRVLRPDLPGLGRSRIPVGVRVVAAQPCRLRGACPRQGGR